MKHIGLVLVLLLGLVPFYKPAQASTNKLLITEVQTAGATAKDEFIEIYNPNNSFFNMNGYEIVYISASGTTVSLQVELSGYLAPSEFIFFTHESAPNVEASGFLQKSSGMAASGGHVVIRNIDTLVELDRLGWGTASDPETESAPAASAGQSLHRMSVLRPVDDDNDTPEEDGDADITDQSDAPIETIPEITNNEGVTEPDPEDEQNTDSTGDQADELVGEDTEDSGDTVDEGDNDESIEETIEVDTSGPFEDTGNNQVDFFVLDTPTPLNTNYDPPDGEFEEETEEGNENTGSEESPEEIEPDPDEAFLGLQPVQVIEVLPDPESPVLDKNGEYVELYNPNNSPVDLTDLVLKTGSTLSTKHTFKGVSLAPGEIRAFYSEDIKISLTNSGGGVKLTLPSGADWSNVATYPKAQTGQAYGLFSSGWQWTTTLTPSAPNKLTRPVTVVKSAKATSKKKSSNSSGLILNKVDPKKFSLFKPLIITEFLPDPEKPKTDANDEFIEVFNPNDMYIEIEGLIIQTGSSFSYSHTFGAGQGIDPGGYFTLYSKDSGLKLSNSGGAVRVLLPNGEQWGEDVTYEDAEEGESYSLSNGVWSWTNNQTPGAENQDSTEKNDDIEVAMASSSSGGYSDEYVEPPKLAGSILSWLVVGGFGLVAVIYSGYEYRRDIANYLHQRRADKTARA